MDITEGAVQKDSPEQEKNYRQDLQESEGMDMRFEDMKNNIPETPDFYS